MRREGLAGPSLRDQLRGHHTRSVHSSCGLFPVAHVGTPCLL